MHFQRGYGYLAVLFLLGALGVPETEASLNLTDFGLGLENLSDTILNFDTSAAGLLDWYFKLNDRCRKNNVQLDMQSLTTAYACLNKIYSNETANADTDDYLRAMCKHWEKTMKCMRPTLKKIEKCFSGDVLSLTGVLTEGLNEVQNAVCSKDTEFFDDIEESGPAALSCLSKNMESIVQKTVKCYAKKKDSSWKVCQGFDTYRQCFLDSLKICNDAKTEEIIERLLDGLGLQKLIYKHVLRCDLDTEENKKQMKQQTHQKIEL